MHREFACLQKAERVSDMCKDVLRNNDIKCSSQHSGTLFVPVVADNCRSGGLRTFQEILGRVYTPNVPSVLLESGKLTAVIARDVEYRFVFTELSCKALIYHL